jgi:putative FmdB family regulatory protein
LPIREYRCDNCGNTFENIELEKTTGIVTCPKCKSKEVHTVFSVFSRSKPSKTSCDVASRFT